MPKITNNYSNEQLEDAAYKKTGTAPTEIPLNSDLGTAAYKDVQTSPSDATPEAVLNNETTHIGGEINYTGSNYQPEVRAGMGVVVELRNNSGSTISSGGTSIGSLLRVIVRDTSGAVTSTAALNSSDVYLNVGVGCPDNQLTSFVRIS